MIVLHQGMGRGKTTQTPMLSEESLALPEHRKVPSVGRVFVKLQVSEYHLYGQSHDPACCSRPFVCAGGISERFLCSLCVMQVLYPVCLLYSVCQA